MSYISEVQVDSGAIQLVGSSLYGVCSTAIGTPAKIVTLASFDTLIHGVTVHVKFTNGNSAEANSALTLKVGSTNAKEISNPGGSVMWSENAVISFTYDGTADKWLVNDGNIASINIENSYSSSSNNAISGQGVAAALNTLGNASTKGTTEQIIETGANANKNDDTIVPTVGAITEYVDNKTAGLTGAMHFIGRTTSTITDGSTTATVIINGSSYTPKSGDVVLSGDHQEYVWTVTNTTTGAGYWELLGDEGSYALKTNTEAVIKTATFTPDVPGKLTTKNTSVPNVTAAGSAATFTVNNGVLQITTGRAPTLGTAITIKEVDTWQEGTAGSLNTTQQTVIVPDT